MITLYASPLCLYCAKVRNTLNDLGLLFTELNVNNSEHRDALIVRGGRNRTPYLVDDSTGVELYESNDIVQYLENTYGKKKSV